MGQYEIGMALRQLLLRSEAARLRERIEEISLATRAMLAKAALDLLEDAGCEVFGCDSGLVSAARKLEALALGDARSCTSML